MTSALLSPTLRPVALCVCLVLAGLVLDRGQGDFLTLGTLASVMQQFATVSPVALAIGLTMIAGEFDLSIGGMTGLAGCIAVLAGAEYPILGVVLAAAACAAIGLAQGLLITRLRLSSVAVSLGGLLTASGLAYVLSANSTLRYSRLDVALLMDRPLLGVLSVRSLVAVLCFVLVGIFMAVTRPGRDVIAVGSDRHAAEIAGVRVTAIRTGVFVASGCLAALCGALLAYSIAAASPGAPSNTLIPAITAAILGGVSLSGGRGTAAGIAAGVLALAILRTGMSSLGLPPFAQDIVTGGVLAAVAFVDAEDIGKRLYAVRRLLRPFLKRNWPA